MTSRREAILPARVCDEDGCEKNYWAKGMCHFHYNKQHRLHNKKAYNKYTRKWRIKNPEANMESNKKSIRAFANRNPGYYRNQKRNRTAYQQKYEQRRRQIDPIFRMRKNLRRRLWGVLKGKHNEGSAVRDMGCNSEGLRLYIERLFTEGMNWENYGEWHIDHIVPISAFDLQNKEEFLRAVHYTNLQPLWAFDNISKGARSIQPVREEEVTA